MAEEKKTRKAEVEIGGRKAVIEGTPEQIEAAFKKMTGFEGGDSAPKQLSRREQVMDLAKKAAGLPVDLAVGGFEGFTGGIPRNIVQETTGIKIPRGNPLTQLAGFIAGPGKLADLAAKGIKLGSIARTSQAGIRAAIPSKAKLFGQPIARGVVGGGVAGALAPQEEFDLGTRSMIAVGGGLLGGAIGAASTIIGPIKIAGRVKNRIKRLNAKKNDLEAEEVAFLRSGQTEKAKQINNQISNLNKQATKAVKTEKDAIDAQIKVLGKRLNDVSDDAAQNVKEPIFRYMKAFKNDWGNRFDDALENAPEQGIGAKSLNKIVDDTVDELIELGIDPKGNALASIRNQLSRIIKPVQKGVEQLDEQIISNNDLVNIRREVSKSFSQGAKSEGRFDVDDIAGVIFNKRLGAVLDDNVPRLKELNAEYKKYSDLARFAFKKFKPKSSEFEITSGSNIIKKVVTGKANKGEVAGVNELERVTGLKFTGESREVAKSIQDLQNIKPEKLKQVEVQFAKRVKDLQTQKEAIESSKRIRTVVKKERLLKINQRIDAYRELQDSISGIVKFGLSAASIGGLVGTFSLLRALQAPQETFTALDLSR